MARVEIRTERNQYPGRWRSGLLGLLAVLANHTTMALASILIVLAVALAVVICPAIWSRKKFRRDAALAVLDRLLRQR
jgi:hypothetical protein